MAAPGQEIEHEPFWVSLAVHPPVVQDVPSDDQQFAGDSDNGFAPTNALGQAFKLCFPGRVEANGYPGSFDQGGA